MCLFVLSNKLSSTAQKWFVLDGGLRVLRRWTQQAIRNDRVSMLYQIVNLCRKLPFDIDSVRAAEIGKAVKRITKHRSPVNDVAPVCALVQTLVGEWKKHAELGTRISRADLGSEVLPVLSKPLPKIVYDMDAYITVHQRREKEIEQDIISAFSDEEAQVMQLEEDAVLIDNIEAEYPMEIAEPESKDDTEAGRSFTASPLSKCQDEENQIQSNLGEKDADSSFSAPPTVSTPTLSTTVSFASTPRNTAAPKLPLSVVLMKQRELQQKSSVSSPTRAPSPQSPNTPKMPTPVLKRRRDDTTSESSSKKSVRWADQFNGRLCETRTVEVDRLRRSVAHYRSLKDLVRREKQQEKSAHLEKVMI